MRLCGLFIIAVMGVTCDALYCPPSRSQLDADRSLIKHVVQHGPAERKLKSDYARENGLTEAELGSRYGASGNFDCGSGSSQGQLIHKNNLILVEAHGLGLKSKCKGKKAPLESCRFTVEVDGKPEVHEIEEVVAAGFECPGGESELLLTGNDWVALRLKKAVDPRIKAYQLLAISEQKDPTKSGLVAVSRSDDFNPKHVQNFKDYPRHYGNCHSTKVVGPKYAEQIQSDCDIGPGGSGGGVFLPGPNPILVGLFENATKSCTDSKGKAVRLAENEVCGVSLITPMNPVMIRAIEAMGRFRPP